MPSLNIDIETIPAAAYIRDLGAPDGRAKMVRRVHEFLDRADAVLHYNGQRFDEPNINTEILIFVSRSLGTDTKASNEGMPLWGQSHATRSDWVPVRGHRVGKPRGRTPHEDAR